MRRRGSRASSDQECIDSAMRRVAVMARACMFWSAEQGCPEQFHAHMPLRALHEFRWDGSGEAGPNFETFNISGCLKGPDDGKPPICLARCRPAGAASTARNPVRHRFAFRFARARSIRRRGPAGFKPDTASPSRACIAPRADRADRAAEDMLLGKRLRRLCRLDSEGDCGQRDCSSMMRRSRRRGSRFSRHARHRR